MSRSWGHSVAVIAFITLVSVGACSRSQDAVPPAPPANVLQAPLEQGWTESERDAFYTTPQGSQLIRYEWYRALEQPGRTDSFDADHLARYGYLDYANSDGLPLGFVRDLDRQWLGLTCAACHTNEINFSGKRWRIDGGPTDADTWSLLSDMQRALAETAADANSEKFKRFAAKVNAATPIDEQTLYRQLKPFSQYFTRFVTFRQHPEAWGRGRIDAFGMIFNRATGIDLNLWEDNIAPPNAPVSVPFLWDSHWHDVVQWNGSAPNALAFQRLSRNVGEVLGVFANANIVNQKPPYLFFETTARRTNLLKIEHLLASLRSPRWPAEFGAIDTALAAKGAGLYRDYCESCHVITPRDQPLQRMRTTTTALDDIGTDRTMAENAKNRMANAGFLEGVRMPPISKRMGPIKSPLPSVELTVRVVIGSILAPPDLSTARALLDQDRRLLLSALKDEDSDEAAGGVGARNVVADLNAQAEQFIIQMKQQTDLLRYRGRPLDGIWATGPYLHNGSVPNLDELLKPARDRMATFHAGTREFDPVHVGFKTDAVPGSFQFDTTKPGNSNAGHDCYLGKGQSGACGDGAGQTRGRVFTDDERKQLVEYLKTL